ncbi:MAG TPA: leucyl aminopeptidase [Acidimicrobiales bacterium]|nr:leucyl aminopeptidase [Acidimicrobiales bacterium]
MTPITDLFGPRLEVTAVPLDADGGGLDPQVSPESEASGELWALGVPVLESESGPVLVEGLSEIAGSIRPVAPDRSVCERHGFSAKPGQVLALFGNPGARGAVTVYLGCGKSSELGADALRRAAAGLVRSAGRSGAAAFLLSSWLAEQAARDDEEGAPADREAASGTTLEGSAGPPENARQGSVSAQRRAAQAVTEGAVLAAYRFLSHKSEHEHATVDRLVVLGVGLDPRALGQGVERGTLVAAAVCAARDLVNEPPSSMTPSRMAEAARQLLGGRVGLSLDVWDEDRIAAERLGGLLGVARGSAEAPRLLRAVYEPAAPLKVDGHVPHVVLVGKGITFDSGGLSLKSAEGMMTMKTDMSGAAAVLAAISACGELGVRVKVTALAPVTENMPGGRATKPGDVLVARDRQTIEVLNTDAEGRLALADGLSLAVELGPDAIVDLATLTGASVAALGGSIAAMFGNDDDLVQRVSRAAARSGEAVWRLPLAQEYRSHIESDVADMKNTGKTGQAGAISAALLLERFVGGVPWVHLDMAGPARSDQDEGILAKGGTGFGVRTLLELLEGYSG